MKRYSMFILIFVLTAALMTGCGCTGPSMDDTKAPTVLPTNEEVAPTTRETTAPTTQATTQPAVIPTEETLLPTETADNGNGLLEDQMTGTVEQTAPENRRAKIR